METILDLAMGWGVASENRCVKAKEILKGHVYHGRHVIACCIWDSGKD